MVPVLCLASVTVCAQSSLSVFHVDLCCQSVNRGPDRAICGCSSLPSHARFWGLCRWGHDSLPRWSCSPPPRFFALMWRFWPTAFLSAQLSQISEQNGAIRSPMFWARHSRIFSPRCSLNSMTQILAHVSYVGQVCERFVALVLFFSPSWAPRCNSAPSVPPRGGSAVPGSPLSVEHSLL